MGQPKLTPNVARFSARQAAGVQRTTEAAQRLFPARDEKVQLLNAGRVALSRWKDQGAKAKIASALTSAVSRSRFLIGWLIFAVLAPCLLLTFLWAWRLTSGEEPRVSREPAPPEAASETVAVLTASERIEAVAGQNVKFALALDGTDGVPPRSVVAVKGLPHGSSLSEGRPYGEDEWNLKPDEIGDLYLALPAGANGRFELGIALVAPDGKVVTSTKTLLAVAPAPAEEVAALQSGSMPLQAGNDAFAPVPSLLPQSSAASPFDPGPQDKAGTALEQAAAIDTGGEESGAQPAASESAAPAAKTAEQAEAPVETPAARSQGMSPSTVGQANDDATNLGTVKPAVFVNLRERPSSSASVLTVIAKGTELRVLERKRGWVRVTDPESGKQGWIYSSTLAGEAKPQERSMRVAPAGSDETNDSFWGKVGRWLRPWKQS